MHSTSVSRRWLLLGSTAVTLLALGVSQATAGRPADQLVPPPPEPVAAPIAADMPSVSGDGRFVAYAGAPGTPDGRTRSIWLRDRADGSQVEITPLDGERAGESAWPVLSADGCSLTFLTEVPFDLFRDDDGIGRWDVYRQELPACGGTLGQLELVSTRGSGFDVSAADDVVPDDRPAVSADGTVVAYTHRFGFGDDRLTGVIVVDLAIAIGEPGRSLPVRGTPFEAPVDQFRHHGLWQPSMNFDGSIIAFTSDATSAALEPGWGAGTVPGEAATSRVFVWNRYEADPTVAVREISSVDSADEGIAHSPSVSGDGLFVAFVSTAHLVVAAEMPACNPECPPQVYLYGRESGSVRLVSRVPGAPGAAPIAADLGATQPALGFSDGEVLFVTRATNLLATRSAGGGTADDGDIVRVVPATGQLQRVSVLADGVTPAPAANSHPRMSSTGRVVVFDTLAGGVFADPTVAGRQIAVLAVTPQVEMADLDMGTIDVDMPSPEWYLVVLNHGPSSFFPKSVTVDNPDFYLNGGSCIDDHLVIAPGASCTVNVIMVPSAAGPHTATLTVSEAGFGAAQVSAQLSATGGTLALAIEPGGGHAGSLVVGTPSTPPMGFTVRNISFDSLAIGSVTVAGEHPQDFAIVGEDCVGRTLANAETCIVQVVFTPSGAGRRTATVMVNTTSGSYATILVSGDGRHRPVMATTTPSIVAGARVGITGSGFSPNTAVTLVWADGSGRTHTVMSDAAGNILASVLVRATDRTGERLLVGETADGQVAGVMVTVIAPNERLTPGSPAWPGR